jgi:deoxyribodipyrimidine photo-lyase
MVNSIYLFQRALRLDDNLGFIECAKESKVLPVFCVDPRQAVPKNNSFFSPFALGFMLQSLQDLNRQLKKHNSSLLILYGEPHKVLPDIIKKYKIDKIYLNEDYTPFARKRAKELSEICQVVEERDYLLFPPGSIVTKSTGKSFRIYTPFLRKTKGRKVKKPIRATKTSFLKHNGGDKKAWDVLKKYSKYAPEYSPGGREEALKRLQAIDKTQKHYASCRNYLKYKTSNLSAYIKFGCISIREAWEAFGKIPGKSSVELRRQLIWREFYYHYYIDYPEVLEWDKNPKEAQVDKKAPDIVKDCFKKLDETGFLHNRGRMILANYMLHNQKTYWKACDKMYAKRLVDYDPLVNIGNWLWIAKQPSFRWLKPRVQKEKWDKECPKISS